MKIPSASVLAENNSEQHPGFKTAEEYAEETRSQAQRHWMTFQKWWGERPAW